MNCVKAALSRRSAILERDRETNETATIEPLKEENIWGEGVKMVSTHTLKLKLLTPTEKADVVEKYKSGMTKTAIADFYGCHPSTVGRILKRIGVTST